MTIVFVSYKKRLQKSELIDVIINDSACVAEGEKTSDQEEETIEELDIDLI